MSEPKLVHKKSFQVVGYTFNANLQEIEEKQLSKKTTERLKANADNIQNKIGNHIYLIQLYPMKEHFNANTDPFTQIIGYEVSEPSDLPPDAIIHHVPENDYVTYTHHGLESELYKSYDYLYGKWLRESNYHTLGYDLELWDERYKPEDTENEIEMYVAVKHT
ncbi:GyrI-like domain-containing protein [Ornithinibacillus bavariensis]|uniref:AraC effector-binding domain-containing protein n=1 Tax=Ornithinibacillus bavariensis TaxID=545502 RepID=A0A920C6X2_9BACI|nr:GyrI-like domain-containing protein [Ornithinibacillus bavariensis]GIO28376.1 hypothetical protein J43TS3_29870 [Ornithinibacillus bavariensis]